MRPIIFHNTQLGFIMQHFSLTQTIPIRTIALDSISSFHSVLFNSTSFLFILILLPSGATVKRSPHHWEVAFRLIECGGLASCASEGARDRRRPPVLVAVVDRGENWVRLN